METLSQIAQRIRKATSVLILTHMRPDGDAYGSALALATALDNLKIPTQVCVESDIPSNLAFVKGLDRVQKKPSGEYDLLVTLDCSDIQRLGALQDTYLQARRKVDTINVDHHLTNPRYAKYNFVKECSANCMHVAALIEALGAPLDQQTAEYLLLGLLTDSGNFSHDDVREETLLLAAKLVRAGADICTLNYQLFKKQPKERAALFAKTMGGMRYYHDNRFAVIVVTRKAIEECGATDGMTEGFVDFPLNVEGVEVAASVMEVKKGQYKISIRTKYYADASQIAAVYGGGGHVRASGFMLFGDLEEVLDRLSYTVYQHLE